MLRQAMAGMLLSTALLCCSGCATAIAIVDHTADSLQRVAEFHRREIQARLDEKAAKHAERLAEHRLETQNARSRIDRSLRTRVGFDLDQRLRLGQLQVDSNKLQELMAKRDKEYEEIEKIYEQLEEAHAQGRRDLIEQNARRLMEKYSAHAGQKCYIPELKEAPGKQLPELPAKRPVLPTEIPLMIPVSLNLGLGEADIQEAKIRELPEQPAKKKECEPPCDGCAGCPRCGGCIARGHCDRCGKAASKGVPYQRPAPKSARGQNADNTSPPDPQPLPQVDTAIYDKPVRTAMPERLPKPLNN